MKPEEKVDVYLTEFNKFKFKAEVKKAISSLAKMPAKKVTKTFDSNWRKFKGTLEANELEDEALKIINNRLGTNFRDLDQVKIGNIEKAFESTMNEDLKHWIQTVKDNFVNTFVIFSGLNLLMELDKLVRPNVDVNWTIVLIYSVVALFAYTGLFLKGWWDWKKDKPEEFEKEGRKKNPFATKKKYKDKDIEIAY